MNIGFVTENRADLGGLTPIIRCAEKCQHGAIVISLEEDAQKDIGKLNYLDWLVFLGDRKGLLHYVIDFAAVHRKVGLAHLSGGDFQECDLVDEQVRYALSAMSHVHFPCTTASFRRLVKAGVNPQRIFTVGSTMVDDLVSFRPVPMDNRGLFNLVLINYEAGWYGMLSDLLGSLKDAPAIIIESNESTINGDIKQLVGMSTKTYLSNQLRDKFLNLLWNCKKFYGNSSSLFLEAQYIGAPCVHIGNRNKGREEAFPGHIAEEKDCRTETGLRKDWRSGAHGDGAAKKIIGVLQHLGRPKNSPWVLKIER